MPAKKLFLVDDDVQMIEANRRLLSHLLGAGVEVVTFHDGTEALEAAVRDGFPDAVLTDDRMPRMSGRELASHLRRLGYLGTIIMLSGTADDGVLAHGIDVRLTKPIDSRTLHRHVANALI